MSSVTLGRWADSVRSVANAGAPAQLLQAQPHERVRAIEAFRDGAGQCRPVDRLLLAALFDGEVPERASGNSLDLVAWQCLLRGEASPKPNAAAGPLTGFGGLFGVPLESGERVEESIEILTEQELACLHAFSWMDGLSTRVRQAASWLLEHIQPDNATTRPWSAHVFAALEAEGDRDAGFYGQTLVHNTLVAAGGRPEPLSACILLDAAEWARRASQGIPLLPRHVR